MLYPVWHKGGAQNPGGGGERPPPPRGAILVGRTGARQVITPAVLFRWRVSVARCVRLDAFMLRISKPLVYYVAHER